MAYIYLLNLYEKIDLQLEETQDLISNGNMTEDKIKYHEGRADILREYKEFLSQNLDDKLPRRIRNRLVKTG